MGRQRGSLGAAYAQAPQEGTPAVPGGRNGFTKGGAAVALSREDSAGGNGHLKVESNDFQCSPKMLARGREEWPNSSPTLAAAPEDWSLVWAPDRSFME